jgi:carbon-monoxide dehydrogenase medium subunit
MPNSHILAEEFAYFEPRTIEEAASLLAAHPGKAKMIAGGTDLLVWMKMGRTHPEYMVNISRIPALRYLIADNGLRIGALTSFHEVENHRLIQKKYTALSEAAKSVTSVQIKHMGTIGGNLCNASPAADSAPPLIAFGGRARMVDDQKERVVPLEEFFVGNGANCLSSKELLVEIQLPDPPGSIGSAFIKMARVAADLAKISIAAMVVRQGSICEDCGIAMGGVAKIPLRLRKTEKILRGKKFDQDLVAKVGQEASEEIQPRSRRSTAFYKKEVTQVLIRDALGLAWARAEEIERAAPVQQSFNPSGR